MGNQTAYLDRDGNLIIDTTRIKTTDYNVGNTRDEILHHLKASTVYGIKKIRNAGNYVATKLLREYGKLRRSRGVPDADENIPESENMANGVTRYPDLLIEK